MKTIKQLLVITFIFGIFSQLQAQKLKDICKHEIIEFRIDNSTMTVTGGNVVFTDNSEITMSTLVDDKFNSVTEVVLELIGKDVKGNKLVVSAPAKFNEKIGYYEAKTKVSANYDNAFIASETNCIVKNKCGDKITTTETFKPSEAKTSFAILLNGSKRPAKYGQCMIFSCVTGTSNKNFIPLDEFELEQTYTEDKATETSMIGVVLSLNTTKEKESSLLESVLMWGEATLDATITVIDGNGKSSFHRSRAKFHSGRAMHTIQDSYASSHNTRGMRVTNVVLTLENSCKEIVDLETEYRSGYQEPTSNFHVWTESWAITPKTKDKNVVNPCPDKYLIENLNVNLYEEKALLAMTFSFSLNNKIENPSSVKLIAEIINCKNDTKFISIEMEYNSETQQWVGTQTLIQDSQCPLTLHNFKAILVAPCGNEYSADFDITAEQLKDKNYLNNIRTWAVTVNAY